MLFRLTKGFLGDMSQKAQNLWNTIPAKGIGLCGEKKRNKLGGKFRRKWTEKAPVGVVKIKIIEQR